MNASRRRTRLVIAVAVCLIAAITFAFRTAPPSSVARMPAALRTLTGTASSCSITEGQTGGTCVITISPAAPAGSSLTFSVAAQTKGTATTAFSPVDATGRAPGGTGADISLTGSTTNTTTVAIATGATSVAFPVTAIDDAYTELDKTIVATISGATGITIDSSAATATITIVDNDRTGIFPVANYGAIPDDGLSDSSAIQAAVAAANASGRGVVTFASGQYDTTPATSGPIRPNPGIAMSGAGDRATILRRAALQCGAAPVVKPKCAVQDVKVDQWNSASDSPWLVISNLIVDGNNSNQATYKDFRQEHAHLFYFTGAIDTSTARAYNTGRLRVITQHVTTRSSVADGISYHVNVEGRDWDTRGEGNFRGHLVMTGGNSVMQWWDFTTTHGGQTGLTENTGIDIEVDAYGKHPSKGLTVDSYVDIRHAVVDADLDASTYLPPDWMGACFTPTGTTQCGTGSTITIDDLQMQPDEGGYYQTGGAIFLGVMRSQDTLTITNSTLRWGGHNKYNESVVWLNQGTINIVDTANIIGDYTYPSHDSAYTPPSLRVQSMGETFSGGTFNLVRSSFTAEAAPNAPPSKCATERMNPSKPAINWASVTLIGTGWCGSGAGYTGGTVNISTAAPGVPTTTTIATTTTTTPDANTNDDAAGAFVFTPSASSGPATTTTTTTTTPTTTTTTPAPTRVELESCTLGGNVIVNSSGPTGQSGSAVFGNNSVGGGTTASCTISAPSAGSYGLTIRYQNAASYSRPVSVNGSALSAPSGPTFPLTSNAWSTLTLTVTLASGSNTIVIDTSYQWFDWLEISAAGGGTTTTTSATTTTTAPPTTTTTPPSEATGWVAYGPTLGIYDTADYNWTNHTTSYTGATATIVWSGTAATLYGVVGPTLGKATVAVDGGSPTTIDLYAATAARQQPIWSTTGLSNTAHTIVVTVLGEKNSSSTGYYVVLDKLVWTGSVTTTTAPTTTTTIPSTFAAPRTTAWSDTFSSFDPSDTATARTWQQNAHWQNAEIGYIDFAGSGSWNANLWQSLAKTSGGSGVLNPFSVSGGVLTITNTPTNSDYAAAIGASATAQGQCGASACTAPGRTGGMLITDRRSNTFLGGYFELTAKMPDAANSAGMFPAFWLYAADGQTNAQGKGDAEIDVWEMFGFADAKTFTSTVHFVNNAHVAVQPARTVGTYTIADPTAWHTWGFDWRLATDPGGAALRWYLDGTLLYEVTGADAAWFDTPMSMRINVAADANWFPAGRRVDGTTSAAWRLQVDQVTWTPTSPTTSPTTTLPPAGAGCVRWEAESSVTRAAWPLGSTIADASGGSYVGDTNLAGSATWTASTPGGSYTIAMRAAGGTGGASRRLSVNSGSPGFVAFPQTTGWQWVQMPGTWTLPAGASSIRLETDNAVSGALSIDTIELCPASTVSTTTAVTTTTAPAGYRTVTISAFVDANGNGRRDGREAAMPRTRWQIVDPTGAVIARGTLGTSPATATVPAGVGWTVRFTAPLRLTTPSIVALPPQSSTAVAAGGCCIRRL